MESHTKGFSDYNTPWTEFRKMSNEKQSFLRCFEDHAADLDLQNTHNCLSIGAGCGESDAFVISKLMPQLQRYIAVEPDKGNIKELVPRVLEALSDRGSMELYCSTIEDAIDRIQGPVDVVLLLEVLYYIPDYKALFKRLKRLLKPGSKIVVAMAKGDSSIYRAVDFLHMKTWSDMSDVQASMRDLCPCLKVKEVTFNCATDVTKVNIASLSIIAATSDVNDDDVTAFKRVVETNELGVMEYQVDIDIFTI